MKGLRSTSLYSGNMDAAEIDAGWCGRSLPEAGPFLQSVIREMRSSTRLLDGQFRVEISRAGWRLLG